MEADEEGGGEEEGGGKKRKRLGRRLGDINSIPELEREYFVEPTPGSGVLKCVPCTWVNQQQGRREEVLISLHKTDNIKSHLGLKKRPPSKKQLQKQQQNPHGPQLPAREAMHTRNVQAWQQHKQQLALQQEQRAPSIASYLQAAGAEVLRQKFIQFAAVLHILRHQRPMLAYQQQQELHQLYHTQGLTHLMPRKHWTDDAGWEMAEIMTLVVGWEQGIGSAAAAFYDQRAKRKAYGESIGH